jgi:hypothetical protein
MYETIGVASHTGVPHQDHCWRLHAGRGLHERLVGRQTSRGPVRPHARTLHAIGAPSAVADSSATTHPATAPRPSRFRRSRIGNALGRVAMDASAEAREQVTAERAREAARHLADDEAVERCLRTRHARRRSL